MNEDLKNAYHKLFNDFLKKCNAKQKRKDRQINNYYDKISRSKQEKLFYEVIVQIGNRDDTGVDSNAADIAVIRYLLIMWGYLSVEILSYMYFVHTSIWMKKLHMYI